MSSLKLGFAPTTRLGESPILKLIRAFAEGGDLDRAGKLFEWEFLRILRLAGGDFGDSNVVRIGNFGKEVLGQELAQLIITRCVDAVVDNVEPTRSSHVSSAYDPDFCD